MGIMEKKMETTIMGYIGIIGYMFQGPDSGNSLSLDELAWPNTAPQQIETVRNEVDVAHIASFFIIECTLPSRLVLTDLLHVCATSPPYPCGRKICTAPSAGQAGSSWTPCAQGHGNYFGFL